MANNEIKTTLKFNLNYESERRAYEVIQKARNSLNFKDGKTFIMAAIMAYESKIIAKTQSESKLRIEDDDIGTFL